MAQKFRQIEDLFGTGSLQTKNKSLFPEKNWENRKTRENAFNFEIQNVLRE